MDGTQGKNYLKNYIQRAGPLLKTVIDTEITAAKNSDMGELPLALLQDFSDMVSQGKGIRGALIELAYKACGGTDSEKILNASIFIELFHSAILIHDDFMDRDSLRRGLETINKKYSRVGKELGIKIPSDHFGNSIAVNLGDSGFYYSWKILLNSGFSPEILVKAGQVYAEYIGRLGLGQALDMTIGGASDAEEKDALKVLYLKSVEYTSILPIKIGAVLAENSDEKIDLAFENYAKCLGWAFQIQDDILGLFANENELGKPIGSDIREGKNTLLMIHLRKHGNPAQIEFQKKVLGNTDITVDDVEKIKNILKESGTLDHVINLGNKYVAEGITYIPQITSNKEVASTLESLIIYMMERTK